jgi:preprotein translocase subunit YajC
MNPGQAQLLMMVAIFAIFYFIVIMPSQKAQKKTQEEHKKMVENLKKNDEVITSGGIHGTIVNVKDTSVVLRVDDNVKIEVQKSCVSSMKRKASEA